MSQTKNSLKDVYLRPEIEFEPILKEILFTLFLIVGEMKRNFVLEVVREEWLIQQKTVIHVLMKQMHVQMFPFA